MAARALRSDACGGVDLISQRVSTWLRILADGESRFLRPMALNRSSSRNRAEHWTTPARRTILVSPNADRIRAWQHDHWGDELKVDLPLERANPDNFDALLIPGGVMSPDRLRMNEAAVRFVKQFANAGKPIAAICHGPWLLVEADVVRNRTVTSWPSLHTDIKNAGGDWVDREVVTDAGLVTSRKPDDIPAFNRKMLEEFAEGTHTPRRKRPKHDSREQNIGGAP